MAIVEGGSTPNHVSSENYSEMLQKIYAPSWQLIPTWENEFGEGNRKGNGMIPFSLLSPVLPDPLLFVGADRCLSNVCTHRGHLICPTAKQMISETLRCPYHGKQFSISGKCLGMPNVKPSSTFPCSEDDLPSLSLTRWHGFTFTHLEVHPLFSLKDELGRWDSYLDFLPLGDMTCHREGITEHRAECHWMLYVENFLEGLHIPFIHPSLLKTMDISKYDTECFTWSNVQIAEGKKHDLGFNLPKGHPCEGRNITGLYFYLFPNLMFNVYPWGISLNIVIPLSPTETRIRFVPFVWHWDLYDKGSGSDLSQVEREDEMALKFVQMGMRSRFFAKPRLLGDWERGVIHLHEMLKNSANIAPLGVTPKRQFI